MHSPVAINSALPMAVSSAAATSRELGKEIWPGELR
jgi:hypothetical protein